MYQIEFFREDGTVKQIRTHKNGEKTKFEFFSEDGTVYQID